MTVFVTSTDTNHTVLIPVNTIAVSCSHYRKAKSGTGGGVVLNDSSSLFTDELSINQPNNGTRFLSIGTGNIFVSGDIALNSVNIVSSGRISKITLTTGNISVKGNIFFNARVADNAVIDMTADSASMNIGKYFILNPKGTLLPGTQSTVIFDGIFPQTIPLKFPSIQFNNVICNNTSADGIALDSNITPQKLQAIFLLLQER